MRFYIVILSVLAVFESRIYTSDGSISRYPWLDDIIKSENEKIGAKFGLFQKSAAAYLSGLQCVVTGKGEDAATERLRFQHYYLKMKQAPTPYTQYALSSGFGYWLYRNLAYHENKKNWGLFKKNAARCIIPFVIFKEMIFSVAELENSIKVKNEYQERSFEEYKKLYSQECEEKRRLAVELDMQKFKHAKEQHDYAKEQEDMQKLFKEKLETMEEGFDKQTKEYERQIAEQKALAQQRLEQYENFVRDCDYFPTKVVADKPKNEWKETARKYMRDLGF